MLTNDEDRERKAELSRPGSYHLVVNPLSFAEFDEYRDNPRYWDSPKSIKFERLRSKHGDHFSNDQTQSNEPSDGPFNDAQMCNDPNTVILKVFEDDTYRIGSPRSAVVQAQCPRTLTPSHPSSVEIAHRTDCFGSSHGDTPLMRMAYQDGRDHQLVYYYKTFVYRHLAQVHRDSLGTSLETGTLLAPDVFERHAASFLPVCLY